MADQNENAFQKQEAISIGGRASKAFKTSRKGKVGAGVPLSCPTQPRLGTEAAPSVLVSGRLAARQATRLRGAAGGGRVGMGVLSTGCVCVCVCVCVCILEGGRSVLVQAAPRPARATGPAALRRLSARESRGGRGYSDTPLAGLYRICAGTRTLDWASRHRRRPSRATTWTRSARSHLMCRSVAASWCARSPAQARARACAPAA